MNYHKVGGLKQQKSILLQLRRSEVQNQGISKVGSFFFLVNILFIYF